VIATTSTAQIRVAGDLWANGPKVNRRTVVVLAKYEEFGEETAETLSDFQRLCLLSKKHQK
jgi:hypothetical protein